MGAESELGKGHCFCPYCDEEIAEASFPTCGTCGVSVFYCPKCRKPTPRENEVCIYCGADIRAEASKGSE